VDPIRRLRQHNGEIKGGARTTARHQQHNWIMPVYIYGFVSKTRGLHFEHVWKRGKTVSSAKKIRGTNGKYLAPGFIRRRERLIQILRVNDQITDGKLMALQKVLSREHGENNPLTIHWPWSLIDLWIQHYSINEWIVPIRFEVDMNM